MELTPTPPRAEDDIDTHRVDVRPTELAIDITGTSDSNFFVGFKGGISQGGLFIANYLNLAIGEVLAVAFTLPGIVAPTHVKCEVVWLRTQNEQSDVPPGAGVRFIDLDPEMKALIERFIENRPAMFFEK